jgi:uncharacterized protein
MRRRHLLWFAGTLAIVTACNVTACNGDKADGRSITPLGPRSRQQSAAHSQPAVLVRSVDGRELRVPVELARTPQERSRGLMYRKSLPAGQGMLFIFDFEEVQRFWMKNTLIPLDMIFIDRKKNIVGIVEQAAPQTMASRYVDEPSIYVLEVSGGWCREHGVVPGSTVVFEGVPL